MSDTSFDPAKLEPVDLSSLNVAFETAKPALCDEVPDGKYRARVCRVMLGLSRKDTPMIRWDLVIVQGEHAQRHLFKNAVITTGSMPYLKRELEIVGLDKVCLSDLHAHLDALVGIELEVAKRTKKDETNVYFNKRVDSAVAEPPEVGNESF